MIRITDWMLIFKGAKTSAQRSPEGLEAPCHELFAATWLPGDELHGGFLQGRHGGRRETGRQAA